MIHNDECKLVTLTRNEAQVTRTETSVFFDFTYHTSDAVTVVGVVLHRLADAIVADGQQFAVGGYIPAHPLVHDGF